MIFFLSLIIIIYHHIKFQKNSRFEHALRIGKQTKCDFMGPSFLILSVNQLRYNACHIYYSVYIFIIVTVEVAGREGGGGGGGVTKKL